jgi:hypothetical protein
MRASLAVLEREVAQLANLPREELTERWRKIYGVAPPKGVRNDLMIRAVAWHLQVKRLGGLSAETRRLLRSAISRVESEMIVRHSHTGSGIGDQGQGGPHDVHKGPSADVAAPTRERRRLTPGARLLRDWGGRTHVVDVIEGGYVFEAKVYPSLTAIAGKITGAHWSGPRFFGL